MLDLFRAILGLEKRSTLANPSSGFLGLLGGAPTAAGVAINATTALNSPTLLASVRVISEAVGSLPIHLYQRGANGSRERETAGPVAALLAGDWAPWAGGTETRTALQLDALLHGAGYGQVVRAGNEPREIHRLDPSTVSRDTSGAEPVFKVQNGAESYSLSWRDVVYLPTPGSSGARLVCLLNLCREAVGLDLAMSGYQGRLFASGARPSGVLKYNKMLSIEQTNRLRESLAQNHGGAASGKTLVLEDGMDFLAVQFSSVDLQFLELRRLAIEEIARVYRVPLSFVGDLSRATWRNLEELSRQFLTYTLLPWLEVWTSSLTRVLLTPEQRAQSFMEFAVDDLMRADLAARFVAYRNAVGGAWMTPNDVRRLDNMPPVEGGDELIRQAGQSGAIPAAVNA